VKVLSTCPSFQAPPGYKSVVKANVFIGKFIDQTFNVAQCLRLMTSWKIIDAAWGPAPQLEPLC